MARKESIGTVCNRIRACGTVHKPNRPVYYNASVSFDIETTSFYEGTEKRACMYAWAFCAEGVTLTGRTWDEFVTLVRE